MDTPDASRWTGDPRHQTIFRTPSCLSVLNAAHKLCVSSPSSSELTNRPRFSPKAEPQGRWFERSAIQPAVTCSSFPLFPFIVVHNFCGGKSSEHLHRPKPQPFNGELSNLDVDAVAVMGNALPHLTASQLAQAARAMRSKLKPQGVLITEHSRLRPAHRRPASCARACILRCSGDAPDCSPGLGLDRQGAIRIPWVSHHFASENGCLLRGELTSALTDAGFGPVRWLTPPTSAYRESISSRSLLVTASPATRRAAFSARSCLNARYTNEPMYQPSMYLYGVSPVV